MSTLTASNAFYSLDASSQSPPKPASPVTPTAQYSSPQAIAARSFINLNPEVRGHHAPFPITPTAASPNGTLEPPAGMSFADYLKTWSDNHTARWLAECKCAHHLETFKANDIRGDILLELDQVILQEMGIASIGDRLRILNAVKNLRQRSANRSPAAVSSSTRHADAISSNQPRVDVPPPSRSHTKRPAPLRLNGNSGQSDLPAVARDPPDSARSNIRPLPQPTQQHQANQSLGTSFNAPNSAHPVTPSHSRSQPPFPPPRGQPPPPPAGRPPPRAGLGSNQHNNWATTPTQEVPSYTSGGLPLAPQQQSQLLTPSTSNWTGSYHSPADSRPGNAGGKIPPRSTSPLPGRGLRANATNPVHGRNGSGSLTSPNTTNSPLNKLPPRPSTTGTTAHPYANPQAATLQPPTNYPVHTLSPIEERSDTLQSSSNTPSPSPYAVGRGPFHSNNASGSGQAPPTLDEIRRKLVKFVLPAEGLTYTIDVATCGGGIEVLEKVLKKFGKGGSKAVDGDAPLEHAVTPRGGLTVDGWGVYLDFGQQDGPGMFSPQSTFDNSSTMHRRTPNRGRTNVNMSCSS